MLSSPWICSFSASMRAHDLCCARPCADITEKILFLTRHSMREVSGMKPQFLQ